MKQWIRGAGAALLALGLVGGVQAAVANYAIDAAHSSVLFSVDHAGWARVFGSFRKVEGELNYDPANPAAGKVKVRVAADSIFTNNTKRDQHLASPDFFNAAEFPEISFESTGVTLKDARNAVLKGNLTLLGVTKPVQLALTLNAVQPDSFTKQTKAGFSLRGTVKRSDFGMTYSIPRVSDEVELIIEIESVQQQ